MAKETTMDSRETRNRLEFLGFTDSDADLLRSMKGRPATGPELRKAKYWLEKFDEDVEDQRRRRTICGTR